MTEAKHHAYRISLKTQLFAFGALIALTALSFGASHLPLAPADTAVALTIAAIKVSIVALFFMHLLEEPPSHRVAALTAIAFIGLAVVFTTLDVVTRPFGYFLWNAPAGAATQPTSPTQR